MRVHYNLKFNIEETTIDTKKNLEIDKDIRSFMLEGLLPNTLYSINISAYFVDGSWGPHKQLHVETSGSSKLKCFV